MLADVDMDIGECNGQHLQAVCRHMRHTHPQSPLYLYIFRVPYQRIGLFTKGD